MWILRQNRMGRENKRKRYRKTKQDKPQKDKTRTTSYRLCIKFGKDSYYQLTFACEVYHVNYISNVYSDKCMLAPCVYDYILGGQNLVSLVHVYNSCISSFSFFFLFFFSSFFVSVILIGSTPGQSIFLLLQMWNLNANESPEARIRYSKLDRKTGLLLPRNSEVFLLTNQHEAKRRNVRQHTR